MALRSRAVLCGVIYLLLAYANAQRAVTVMVDWMVHGPSPLGGDLILPGHAALHIAGDATDGPVRIQVAAYEGYFSVDFLDYSVGNSKQPIGLDADGGDPNTDYPSGRRLINAGTTTLTNAELLDGANEGVGIALDIVSDPAGPFNGNYVTGQSGCMVFVQKMLGKLFPGTQFPTFDAWVLKYQIYIHNNYQFLIPQALRVVYRQIQDWGDSSQNLVKIWKIVGHNQLSVLAPSAPQGPALLLADESELFGGDIPIASPWDEQKPPTIQLGGDPPTSPFALVDDNAPSTTSEGISDLALVRVNKVLATLALIPESAIQAAGAAAALVGAAFVILDFVNGNWIGGAFGAAGLVLGAIAAGSVAGPVGWLIGGLVAALFAILPGLFTGGTNMPEINNMTQIIQFKMFGDAKHTGNEKCQEQNPSCQAVYGPGTLSTVFQWDYFDSITFLINFNHGYPMTIPDMAVAFQVNGTAGAVATMDCHNGKWVLVGGHSAAGGYVGDNPKWCNHPQFGMGRDFELPVINQTAANVFNRIIPAPGGDCKLIDAASNAQGFPDYNLTVSGLPVSIACNLTAAAAGPWSPLNPGASANGTNASPANASTNSQGGGYVKPPAPAAFAAAFDASNSVCISNPQSATPTFCLPNGTYDQPTGLFGYTITGANAVSIPDGGSIGLQSYHTFRADARPVVATFTTSQDSSSGFAKAVTNLNAGHTPGLIFIDVPATIPLPPIACFYTKTQYLGDMFCLGVGGNSFTAPGINVVQSVALFGGATAWIYAQAYGDAGGARLTASVADLSTEPYGTGGNFAGKTVAAWIYGANDS